MFNVSRVGVINSDGEWFSEVVKKIPKGKIVTYSLNGRNKGDITPRTIPFKIKTNLIGEFNKENILAAYATAKILGIDDEVIDKAIKSYIPPPGRQEILNTKDEFTVVVDFAHTPNSFERILPEIRKVTQGRLIHVFGAAIVTGKQHLS